MKEKNAIKTFPGKPGFPSTAKPVHTAKRRMAMMNVTQAEVRLCRSGGTCRFVPMYISEVELMGKAD